MKLFDLPATFDQLLAHQLPLFVHLNVGLGLNHSDLCLSTPDLDSLVVQELDEVFDLAFVISDLLPEPLILIVHGLVLAIQILDLLL